MQAGQAVLFVFFPACIRITDTLSEHRRETLFWGLNKLMLDLLSLELLDHKKLGNFFVFLHKMKRAIAGFTLATACALTKLHHL
jgi:hypothetical protein